MLFNPDPSMVNLFLGVPSSNRKWGLQKAWIFSRIFCFKDDLSTFSSDKFENYCEDVYPDELILKKENEDPCQASFLDLLIKLQDRKFDQSLFLFCLLYAFPFDINHMRYLDSNIQT